MSLALAPCADPAFSWLKAEIESYPRLSGYYLIKLIEIPPLPSDEEARAAFLDVIFRLFDDQSWAQPPPDAPSWNEHETSREAAAEEAVAALMGGPQIGHLDYTIPAEQARRFWERFEALFAPPRRYYIDMGFGDPAYVFLCGVVIVGLRRAGILWVVESD